MAHRLRSLGNTRDRALRFLHALYLGSRDATDALALAQLAPLGGGPLPWSGFSMRPAAIAAVVAETLRSQPRTVVECGSGNSTIFLARTLRHLGEGHVVTLEHDAYWAGVTRGLLAREQLTEQATVVLAPLVGGWYDQACIPRLDRIDMLIVDGPPAYADPGARYPALPFFAASLADGAAVFLDDTNRPGERAVLARWEAESTIAFCLHHGGFAAGRYAAP